MKLRALLAVAALALIAQSSVRAIPVHYEGAIPNNGTVTGSVGGFGFIDEDAANVDFWRFQAIAAQRLTIRGTRLDSGLDPALALYRGITSADQSNFLFDADWGGLTFLAIADDEVPFPGGPFGDPLLAGFIAPTTGSYTIAIGGFASNGPGPFRYSLSLQAVTQAVPEPATLMLLAAGLLSLVWMRSRVQ